MHIDSRRDLDFYKSSVAGNLVTVIPLLQNTRDHFIANNIVALYAVCNGDEFIFPYKHPESAYSDYSIEDTLCGAKCFFYNKSILDYQKIATHNVYDLELVHYLNEVKALALEEVHTEYFYSRLHSRYRKPNTLVSLANFVKFAREVILHSNLTEASGIEYYSKLQQLLFKVESNGIQVDKDYFTPLYGTPINLIEERVYTKYNFFTTTGRPSNRFGGINFAALNKQDDTRKCFVSRFSEGKLVELDFKAYHPHIIAYLCNYNFGKQDVYEHLAEYYFDTSKVTKNQINQAKELTFNQIYGGINKKYWNIPFFTAVKDFTTHLYRLYREQGFVESSISGRKFCVVDDEDITDSKLFNYYIQMTETELNGLYLEKLLSTVNSELAVPVLYTYDSVVFDCKNEYISVLVDKIITSTTDNFPITVKVGDNYKEMINYIYEATTSMHIH